MNLDDAISAHAQWKTKLASYLSNPDRSLNVSGRSAQRVRPGIERRREIHHGHKIKIVARQQCEAQ